MKKARMKSDPSRTESSAAVGKVRAIEQICRLRGGSQAHLMRCSDKHYYVVKFKNNPQSIRVLINERIAVELASELGLPIPRAALVDVSPFLIFYTTELRVEGTTGTIPCSFGLQFGSEYMCDPHNVRPFVHPDWKLATASNIPDAWGVLVFDLWTGNLDQRQFVLAERDLIDNRIYMIDQGFCFGGNKWTFIDTPLRCKCSLLRLYRGISGMSSFEPWLAKLESREMSEKVQSVINLVPEEWCGTSREELKGLLACLNERRFRVRSLLTALRNRHPDLFPRWVQ
jgi:hypothetical protein